MHLISNELCIIGTNSWIIPDSPRNKAFKSYLDSLLDNEE